MSGPRAGSFEAPQKHWQRMHRSSSATTAGSVVSVPIGHATVQYEEQTTHRFTCHFGRGLHSRNELKQTDTSIGRLAGERTVLVASLLTVRVTRVHR